MNKLTIITAFALASLASAPIHADGGAATFSGVTNSSLMLDTTLGDASSEIMSTTLKVPGDKKSLLIGVSLESSLLTKSRKKGLPETCAGVEVTVKIDGTPVAPGTVRFNTRCQKFDAVFNDIAAKCPVAPDANGLIQVSDGCTFTDQEIYKILSTTSANHFNFIAPEVGHGDHVITVEARVSASSIDGVIAALPPAPGAPTTPVPAPIASLNASSIAAINLGTLSVQVVKAAHDHDDDDDDHGHHGHGHGHGHGHHFDDIVAE